MKFLNYPLPASIVIAAVLYSSLDPTPAQAEGFASYPVSEQLRVRTGPATATEQMGLVYKGYDVEVLCQDVGEVINGNPYWDFIQYPVLSQPGTVKRGWVSDAFVMTGAERLSAVKLGSCGQPMTEPGPPIDAPDANPEDRAPCTTASPCITAAPSRPDCLLHADYESVRALLVRQSPDGRSAALCNVPSSIEAISGFNPMLDIVDWADWAPGEVPDVTWSVIGREHDLCSVPFDVLNPNSTGEPTRGVGKYSFAIACHMHDLGYEAIRQGLLPPEAKGAVDDVWHEVMDGTCDTWHPGDGSCKWWSQRFYEVVRELGSP